MKSIKISVAAVLIMSGCASSPEYRLGQFTAASSYNVSNLDYTSSASPRVMGEDCFEINDNPNDSRLQRAMDNAINNGRDKGISGDLLVNVRVDLVNKTKPGFFGLPTMNNCIVVEGDLVLIKSNKL